MPRDGVQITTLNSNIDHPCQVRVSSIRLPVYAYTPLEISKQLLKAFGLPEYSELAEDPAKLQSVVKLRVRRVAS